MKGITPVNTCPSVTGTGEELFTTNTFRPTGGVSTPISASFTETTPSQIGSKPCAAITGYMIGSVLTMIPIGSMKQPRTVNTPTYPMKSWYIPVPTHTNAL